MPPPIPSMPYAPKSLYTPRYADNIAQLLTRQGDIQAAGAARSGEIWGNAVGQLGQIAGQAVQGYAQHQQQEQARKTMEQRQEMFGAALETWDGKDPMSLYRKMAVVVGPEDALKVASGVVGLQNLAQKKDAPDLKDFQATVGGLYATKKALGEEYLAKNWASIAPTLAPGVKQFLGVELPQEYTPEIGQNIDALHDEWKPKEMDMTATAPHVVSPGSALVGPTGEMLYQAPARPETPSQPSFQAKDVLNDEGKPVMANFDARTGRYVDPSTNQPIKNPRPVPSAATTQDERKFAQAGPILKSVSELSEKINTLQGVVATAAGAAAKAKAKVNLDDDVAEYEALISGFTPLVARALGHTGVLTQQDVDSVKALFPRPEDSKSLRDRKVKRIMSIIGELEGGSAPAKAGASSDEGWTELSGGIRIREKKQ